MTPQDALNKAGGNVTAAARMLGIARSTFRRQLAGAIPRGQRKPPSENKGRTLAQFRQAHDKDTIIPAKIRTALKELGAAWLYEGEFIKLAGITYADVNAYRELFAANVIVLRSDNKRVWAGTTGLAKQLRELV
jgi:transposase